MNSKSLSMYLKLTITVAILTFSGCSKSETLAKPSSSATTVTTQATTPAPSIPPKISCKKGKDVRTLEITKKEFGCLLDYKKRGKTTAVSKSPDGLDQCKQNEKRIQTNLEHAGFTCT